MRIKRHFAGYYTVTNQKTGRSVTVERRDDLDGWLASADWTFNYYTDPVATYRDAKAAAVEMLS